MHVTGREYQQMNKRVEPKSPVGKNGVWAFVVGGLICTAGQLLTTWYQSFNLTLPTARMLGSVTLMLVSMIATGFGVYDNVAKHAGAGTLVPITGFANAMVSPAIEFKSEGYVLGLGAKMFSIAGPVIVYGTVAGVIYGLIYWITTLF
jgi:stage V sporulation protein AC